MTCASQTFSNNVRGFDIRGMNKLLTMAGVLSIPPTAIEAEDGAPSSFSVMSSEARQPYQNLPVDRFPRVATPARNDSKPQIHRESETPSQQPARGRRYKTLHRVVRLAVVDNFCQRLLYQFTHLAGADFELAFACQIFRPITGI